MTQAEIETRLRDLEFEFEAMRRAGKAPSASPMARLALAVEQTIAQLEKWQTDHAETMKDDSYDDYRDVVSTLPSLKREFDAYKQWRVHK